MIHLLFFLPIISNDFLTDASAVIEKDIASIWVKKDFSRKEEKDISIFILTYRGRETFGNLLEKYNKESEEIKIREVKTQKKTGEEIVPEEKAIGDLSTVEKFLAPKYANSRIKSITFSAVEESARLIYRSEKTVKEKKKEFFGSKVFQKDEPVLYSAITLKTPFPIKYQTIGEVKVKEEKKADYFSYRFFCESLPRVKVEPNRVAIGEISPRVYWTNLKDWQEVWHLLKNDFYPRVVIKGEIERKAKELTREKERMEAVREIYNYVTKNWRDIPLTVQDAGFKPTKADEVYKQKYADNKDKCLLLLSMLEAVGITVYPGYVAKEIIKDIPSPVYFFYLILVLEIDNRYLFLDPTFPEKVSFNLSFPSILANYNEGFPILPDLTGREVFLVKPDTFFFLSIPYPEEITSEISYSLSLDSLGELVGEINATLDGISAIELRANYKDKTEKEKEIALKGVLSQIKTGIKLLNWQIENLREPLKPVQIYLRFAAERYGIQERERINFNLLPYLFFPNFSSYFSLPERKYPLDIKVPASYKYHLQLTIPQGYEIYHFPKDFTFTDSLIGLKISSLRGISSRTFQLNKEIRFPKRRYRPNEYDRLKNIWSDFAKPESGFIILRKI